MNNKGLTDIIAIVLLLMITISMVGFAWMWLQRVSQSSLDQSKQGVDKIAQSSGEVLQIENLFYAAGNGGNITVRNIGSEQVPLNGTVVYVNGVATTCSWYTVSGLSIGSNAVINVSAIDVCNITIVNPCTSLRLTTPGGSDTYSC